MTRVIGQIDSAKALRNELNRRGIYLFNSTGEIHRFWETYEGEKYEIRLKYKELVRQEIEETKQRIEEDEKVVEEVQTAEKLKLEVRMDGLKYRLDELEASKKTGLAGLVFRIKRQRLRRKLGYLESNFEVMVDNATRSIRQRVFSMREVESIVEQLEQLRLNY